jgi:hypothetical protein
MDDAARREVARVVSAEPGRLRGALARPALVVIGAASLAPVLAAALATGDVAAAVAGVFGNVGAGPASEFFVKQARRLRGKDRPPPTVDEVREMLDVELGRMLERQDAASDELSATLTAHLQRVGGLEAALTAADGELREHLARCFAELVAQGQTVLRRMDDSAIEHHRQSQAHREQMTLLEDIAGRVSDLTRQKRQPDEIRHTHRFPEPGDAGPRVAVFTGSAAGLDDGPVGWRARATVVIGGVEYLLHDYGVDEAPSPDGSYVWRQARAARIPSTDALGGCYVWLRQVGRLRPSSAADRAVAGLEAERPLARRMGRVSGIPHVLAPVREGDTVTSIVAWPLSKVWQGPCETLADLLGPPGQALGDPLRMARLLVGLAGLAATLGRVHRRGATSHRHLSAAGVVRRDDGVLVLRDWGLAGLVPRPGEVTDSTDDEVCVAPEQRHGGDGRPGRATDTYQMAALAYLLLSGHRPVPGRALPLRALVDAVPDAAARAVDAALAVDPAERPPMESLASALRQPIEPVGPVNPGDAAPSAPGPQ